MSSTVIVDRIAVYPIKSLDPAIVSEARVLPGGALAHDREFVLLDDQGKWVNGKRDPRIHRIRADYDLSRFTVTLSSSGDAERRTFHLIEDRRGLEAWFSACFGVSVTMERNETTGFPDDTESPGPTIVSSATMREVSSWFDIADPAETRRRFRANIELRTDEPFWEDRLFGADGTAVGFRIGEVSFLGVNPCQRCVVPSRNPNTGDATPDFQRLFAEKRETALPSWAAASRFSHYYRLSVNTRIPPSESNRVLRIGDSVTLRSP